MRGDQNKSATARGDGVLWCLLVGFALVAVWAGAPHLIDYDSAQFALALEQHDLRLHQPQPPGAFFFVELCRQVSAFTRDAYSALRVVSIALLVASALVLYSFTTWLHDRITARIAVLLFVTSPVVLFHALTTAVYPADAFASALVALLCWRARYGDRRWLCAAAACVGALGGLRPTSLVILLPLVVFTAVRAHTGWRVLGLASASFALGVLIWFVPQLGVSGGFGAYWTGNRELQAHVLAKSPLQAGWHPLVTHFHRAASVLVFGVGAARFAVLFLASRRARYDGERAFLAAWILPGLAFILAYHFPKSGYALALWPALCLFLARRARTLVSRAARTALGVALAFDLAVFFLVPTMHLCCRQAWEIEEAARYDSAALVQWPWVPSAWMRPTRWPAGAWSAAQSVFGKVDFHFDRTRDFDFGGVLEALRHLGLPRDDVLWIGDHATRAACEAMPEQLVVHVDVNRTVPFVRYQGRRGTMLGDTFEVPPEVRALLLERQSGTLDFTGSAGREIDLPVPLRQRFVFWEIGAGAFECEFTSRPTLGAERVRLGIQRRD